MSAPASPRARARAWQSLIAAMLLLAAAISEEGQLWIADMVSVGLPPLAGERIARPDRSANAMPQAAAQPRTANVTRVAAANGADATARPALPRERWPLSVYVAPRRAAAASWEGEGLPVEPMAYLQLPELAVEAGAMNAQSAQQCWDSPHCSPDPIPVSRGMWMDDAHLAHYIQPPPVPEPKMWLMLLSGLLFTGLICLRHAARHIPAFKGVAHG